MRSQMYPFLSTIRPPFHDVESEPFLFHVTIPVVPFHGILIVPSRNPFSLEARCFSIEAFVRLRPLLALLIFRFVSSLCFRPM